MQSTSELRAGVTAAGRLPLQGQDYVFTTEGHPLPVSALLQRKRDSPHRPPGNATLATLLAHPFFRKQAELRSFQEASGPSWTHNLVAKARLAAAQEEAAAKHEAPAVCDVSGMAVTLENDVSRINVR